MRRLLSMGVTTVLAMTMLGGLSSPASAATSISGPDGPWAGVVEVSIASDAAYLRLQYSGSGGTRYSQFANTGDVSSPMTRQVSTWGDGANWDTPLTLRVQECADATAASCSTAVASLERLVRQAPENTPTFDWEVPNTLMIPERQAYATATSVPLGTVEARIAYGTPFRQDARIIALPEGERTLIDFTPVEYVARRTLTVRWCSPDHPTYCGAVKVQDGLTPLSVVRELAIFINVNRNSDEPIYFSNDPDSPDAGEDVRFYVPNKEPGFVQIPEPMPATWSVVNGAGDVVVGPVELGSAGGDIPVVVNPTAEGGPIPDGDYTLRAHVSMTADGVTKTDTTDLPIYIGAQPPQYPIYLGHGDVLRNVRGADPGVVSFSLAGRPEDSATGKAHITTTTGEPVRTVSGVRSTWGGFRASWDGKNAAGEVMPPGQYEVAVEITDEWGRTSRSTSNSRIDVQHLVTEHLIGPMRRLPDPNPVYSTFGDCASWERRADLVVEMRGGNCIGPNIYYQFRPDTGIHTNVNRMIRARLELYGHGVPTTSTLTTAFRFAVSPRSARTYAPYEITGTQGWHYSGWAVRPLGRAGATNAHPWVEMQLGDDEGFDVKYYRVRTAFRTWVTPES